MKNILVFNAGSSSIKFALYSSLELSRPVYAGELTRIGTKGGTFGFRRAGASPEAGPADAANHEEAFRRIFSRIRSLEGPGPDVIAHRIVHGGPRYGEPTLLTPEVTADIRRLVPYAPEHLPPALKGVELAAGFMEKARQVACFDTAFHRTMPEVARTYALPLPVRERGVERYGFHGLSYQYLLRELRRMGVGAAVSGRVVLAHLGHGASMAAVRDGRSIETSMGFSPAGGLVMSTRTGDLDPGVVLYLLEEAGMSPPEVKDMVNRRSGLLALSGRSDDMRDLLSAEASDPAARLAVELFCYQARKQLGSLFAVLGGLDLLVFTGGIGEHSPEVRRRICRGLGCMGLRLDEERNSGNAAVISLDSPGRAMVRVMQTDEEQLIAREALKLVESL
ncbi:acetate/propionate family kinase [Chlorobium sp. N1]|uniref:acetate/propionate family kinase n=1 Tax=Chlorobium sp. N1 TaxID=2491138 RepID=UPI00103CB2AF|nr:acetate/propionate family kinase [Chlorobium sp. N1]TCD48677.1 acetate/propionate family kinase [Chlorobium sp. N1]